MEVANEVSEEDKIEVTAALQKQSLDSSQHSMKGNLNTFGMERQ